MEMKNMMDMKNIMEMKDVVEMKHVVEQRRKQLLQWKKEKEKALVKVPEGFLRICCHGDRTQYYRRKDSKDLNGVYLREKEMDVARKLAQKDYDRKVVRAVEEELRAIDKFLSDYPVKNVEKIYESLHKERQKLVLPIKKTDWQYRQEWEGITYEGKEFYEDEPEFYTAKGERVRSKSEVIIADLLNREAIPYRYEYPIILKGVGTVYPDFTVLNIKTRKEIYWEHLGMMDDFRYVENAIKKINEYEQNGIFPGDNLILTYETKKNPVNRKTINLVVRHYFSD